MKKYFIRIYLLVIIFIATLVPSLYAKNLLFQAEANLNNIRWTTFVKAYNTSSSSNHTDPKILRDRTGGALFYQTRYITFHLEDGAYYSDKQETGNDELIYFDDSHGNTITNSNYKDYDSLVDYR